MSPVTTTRAGGKAAKSHISPLAGRTISLVDGGVVAGGIKGYVSRKTAVSPLFSQS
jgi:hypothetical protein